MKHTKGKWAQDGRMIYSPGFGVVCELSEPHPEDRMLQHERIGTGSPDRAEAMANARLIAAAPRMYEYVQQKAGEGDKHAIEILSSLRD